MRFVAYVGGLLGLTLLVVLLVRADFGAMLHVWQLAGLSLLWLVPYRGLYFSLYAIGWMQLLRPYNQPPRATFRYLLWVTTLREAIDRLLPVASVGGGVVAVRLLRFRGLAAAPVSATVIVEIILTLWASYLFALLSFVLAMARSELPRPDLKIMTVLLGTLPVPVILLLLLRHGTVFARLQRFFSRLVDVDALSEGAAVLDRELKAGLKRWPTLLITGVLQLAALMSAAFEIWFALRLFGHPITPSVALILEGATQAVRHLAFIVPAGLGVQEAGLVLFGQAFGLDAELALAVSMVKRLRELLCGLPALPVWQWLEVQRR